MLQALRDHTFRHFPAELDPELATSSLGAAGFSVLGGLRTATAKGEDVQVEEIEVEWSDLIWVAWRLRWWEWAALALNAGTLEVIEGGKFSLVGPKIGWEDITQNEVECVRQGPWNALAALVYGTSKVSTWACPPPPPKILFMRERRRERIITVTKQKKSNNNNNNNSKIKIWSIVRG